MSDMTRLFLALDLSIAVAERMVLIQEELARVLPKEASARLVAPENIHVTLKFIGEVDALMVPVIATRITEVTRPLFPFEFRCIGAGCFPSNEAAQIVWAGLDDQGAEVMGLLHQTFENELENVGISPDPREYRPHVTLARLRAERAVDVTGFIETLSDVDLGVNYVRDVILFASELTKDGPVYRVVQRFALGEA